MSARELGGVGEGLRAVDRAEPLAQLQLGNKLPSLRNPLLMGEGGHLFPTASILDKPLSCGRKN